MAAGSSVGKETPLAAAVAYALLDDPPGMPRSGWRVAESDEGGIMVRSGTSRLHASQDPQNGTWWIDSGEVC